MHRKEQPMPELTSYDSPDLPADLKCQLLSFVRMEWSWIYTPENRLWDYTDKPTHPRNFVISEQGVLISHAETNWRMLDHGGEAYKVYGVSGVFTYPAFRKEGFGAQLVEAASRHIDASDADFALLFCLPELEAFYAKQGWEAMRGTRIAYGKADAPEIDEHAFTMVRFASAKGQQARASLAGSTFYIGPYMW
jgi:GNAT superfamily N-acetyltransferase